MGFKRTFEAVKVKTFRARLLDCNGNYITIRISITRNIRYFNGHISVTLASKHSVCCVGGFY